MRDYVTVAAWDPRTMRAAVALTDYGTAERGRRRETARRALSRVDPLGTYPESAVAWSSREDSQGRADYAADALEAAGYLVERKTVLKPRGYECWESAQTLHDFRRYCEETAREFCERNGLAGDENAMARAVELLEGYWKERDPRIARAL